MRKKLILCLLIILILMTGILLVVGLKDDMYIVESYISLQQRTKELNKKLQDLNQKNTLEYENKKEILLKASKDYNIKKNECKKLINNIQSVGVNKENVFDLYEIDFLWTIIGNYATEEKVELQLDIVEITNNIDVLNKDYILCDLNFKVLGEYLSISDFIYDLENDERLNFEIRDFTLKKEEKNLESKFIVKSAPINKINLSKSKDIDIIYEE